ncbi:hypothetical protein PS6_011301 [Mucor atramentarius]
MTHLSLSVADQIKGRFRIGGTFYLVVHNVDQEAYITIHGRNDKILLQSLPDLPFIQSSYGRDQIIAGDGGVFKIIEAVDGPSNTTVAQTIDTITSNDTGLHLNGTIKFTSCQHIGYSFKLQELSKKQLDFSIQLGIAHDKKSPHRIIFNFKSNTHEDFYGFGEQFSYSTLKGQKVPIFVREQGIGRGEEPVTSILNDPSGVFGDFAGGDSFTTYCSVPQFLSTDNRSLVLHNSEYSSFDLRKDDRVSVRLNATLLEGRLFQGDNLLDLVSEYTSYSGRMHLLPDWVSDGAVVGIQGGTQKVRKVIRQLQHHNTPIAAVWLQDWCGKRLQKTPNGVEFKRLWWNWESDDTLYPDWPTFVNDELRSQNIRVLSYVNTFLTNVEKKQSYRNNYFLEAEAHGYLVKDPSSTSKHQTLIISSGTDFEAGILDLTNPDAAVWFKSIVKQHVYDAGVSGMMTDFGEYLPYHSEKVSLYSGISSEVYHNRYPQEWAKLHSELVHEIGLEDEAVCFYRAGFTRTPGFINLMWAGDQNVAWDAHDGIKSAVTGMLSGGFSGFSITHSDIGGYTTISAAPLLELVRSKELLFRWMELSAFTAVFRTHEGIIPELNAQFYDDEESLAYFAFCAKLYASLSPYRKKLIQEAHTRGWPLMRHLVFYYPHDPVVRRITYSQYLLGDSLLVAPMLAPSTSHVKVYLPKEEGVTWRHVWSNQSFTPTGQDISVASPFQRPAVFIKEPRQDGGLLDEFIAFTAEQSNA